MFGAKLGRSIRDTDAPLGMQMGAIMQGVDVVRREKRREDKEPSPGIY